jgi:hypothetical protein
MPQRNLTGDTGKSKYPKVCVAEDIYDTELAGISDIIIVAKMNVPNETTQKIKAVFRLNTGEHVEKWMTNVVTKGSGEYSNSALYDFLDKMGWLDEYSKDPSLDIDEVFLTWLRGKIEKEHPKVRVLVKNAKKGTPDEYSTVREIVRRIAA